MAKREEYNVNWNNVKWRYRLKETLMRRSTARNRGVKLERKGDGVKYSKR